MKKRNETKRENKRGTKRGMEYCTFYWSIMEGVRYLEVFKTEAEALKNFRANYRSFFDWTTRFSPRKTPCAYGFPHRKYYCMSLRDYRTHFQEAGGHEGETHEKPRRRNK